MEFRLLALSSFSSFFVPFESRVSEEAPPSFSHLPFPSYLFKPALKILDGREVVEEDAVAGGDGLAGFLGEFAVAGEADGEVDVLIIVLGDRFFVADLTVKAGGRPVAH